MLSLFSSKERQENEDLVATMERQRPIGKRSGVIHTRLQISVFLRFFYSVSEFGSYILIRYFVSLNRLNIRPDLNLL